MAEDKTFPEVYKEFRVLPAIEQTKILIIDKLKMLFDAITVMFQNKELNKIDKEIISLVQASEMTLYMILKPKIYEYVAKLESQLINNPNQSEIQKVMLESFKSLLVMDNFLMNPTSFDITKVIIYADIINLFCHEYGITKITYFGGTRPERDIYSF